MATLPVDQAPAPQWIKKMFPGKVGRDHLGLGSVSSDQILPSLSPGINVLTIHPRYFSFYVFLLDEFWRRDRIRNRKSWSKFYRPREFIYSLGCHLCDQPEHGSIGNVVGSAKTAGLARRQLETYDTTYHYIDSDLGGYGLYYRSVMAELGVVYPGGRGLPYPVDVPTDTGKQLADAFRTGIGDTEYFTQYFANDEAQVPLDVVKMYARKACLCQVKTGTDDLDLLRGIFLRGGAPDQASSRRATFAFLLDLANQTAGHAIDQDLYRQLIYFGSGEGNLTYAPSPPVAERARRWRLYQAREYYSYALNALFGYFSSWGLQQGGEVSPLPLQAFWEHLYQSALSFSAMADSLTISGAAPDGDRSFAEVCDWVENAADLRSDIEAPYRFDSALHEHHLYRLIRQHRNRSDIAVPAALTMLALVWLRFSARELQLRPEWEVARMGSDGRLSMASFINQLRRRASSDYTLAEFARWIVRDYVIDQHQIVALRKMPDNTFRFSWDRDRLRFFRLENSLEFMDSRFDALAATLQDLGFCGDFSLGTQALTPAGEAFVAEGADGQT